MSILEYWVSVCVCGLLKLVPLERMKKIKTMELLY